MAYTTINKSTDNFNTKLYTGNATQRTIDVGFQPDLVWGKLRSTTGNHWIWDSIRGANYYLKSNATDGNNTGGGQDLNGFVSNGFTVGTGTRMNTNSETMASWNWKAGTGQGSSNTDGSINTTYTSVNTTAGFSISKWSGSGYNATIGHGLGVAPKMVIVKRLTGVADWVVGHDSMGWTKYIYLSSTAAQVDSASAAWNDTAPTNSVFTVATNTQVNASGSDYVAYCFAEKTGYSKFGSYVANGSSTNATFTYTGFAPKFVMIKRITSADHWVMNDSTRSTNENNNTLKANSSDAEYTSTAYGIDLLSNGFKPYTSDGNYNANGDTYIYMAFGQSLVGSNNVPCTAR